MKERLGVLAALALGVTLMSCKNYINWKNHISFRSYGKGAQLSHIDPDETVHGAVRANLNYISMSLDTVFFRDLPGLSDRSVAFGFQLTGALPKGKAIKTVLDISKGVGEHAFLSFDNLVVVQPFLYTGQNVTITLHFRAVDKDEAANIRGRLQGAGETVKKISPASYAALDTGLDLFTSIISAFTKKEMSWKYSFTLFPVDSTYRDKPEMLLTAARHILLCIPTADAPRVYRKLKPRYLLRMLKLRGNRLVWKKSEAEYTKTPYIVLNITRYKRYPQPDTRLRQMARLVDNLIENKNYQLAQSNLSNLGTAINNDPIITENEKNLERVWRDMRAARIEAAMAIQNAKRLEAQGSKGLAQAELKKALDQTILQIKYLGMIRSQFTPILYLYEIKKIQFLLSRLTMTGERLANKVGHSMYELNRVLKDYRKRVKGAKALMSLKKTYKPKPFPKIKLPPEEELKAIAFKPLVKKWWLWTLVGLAAAGAGVGTYFLLKGGSAAAAVPGETVPLGPVGP